MVPAPRPRSVPDEKIAWWFRREPARRWLLTLAAKAEDEPDAFRAALAHHLAHRLARVPGPTSLARGARRIRSLD